VTTGYKEGSVQQPEDWKLLRKLSAAFSGQIGVFLLAFASQIVIARALGPAGKGAFSLVILIVNVVYIFAHGSLGSANTHFTGRHPASKAGIFGNSFTIALLWGGTVALLFITIVEGLLAKTLPDIDPALVKMTAIAIPMMILLDYCNTIVMGLDRIARYSLIIVSRELVFLVGLFLLLLIAPLTVGGVLNTWVLVVGLASIFAAWSAWSGVGFRFKIDLRLWFSMAKFSLQSHAANLSTFLKMRFDVLMVAYFLDLKEVGYYSIANAIIAVLWFIPVAVSMVLTPHISWRDDQAGNILTPPLCRMAFFLTAIAGLTIAIFGWVGIKLVFGELFLPAYLPLLILIPGAVVYSLAKLLSGDLVGRGLPHYAMKISLVALGLNVGINLILIPLFGIIGAALTATLTHSVTGLLFLRAFQRESGASVSEALVIRRGDLAQLGQIIGRIVSKR